MRVEIDMDIVPDWARTNDTGVFTMYVMSKLKEAGVPTTGGPLSLMPDYRKGTLTVFNEPLSGNKIYDWKNY